MRVAIDDADDLSVLARRGSASAVEAAVSRQVRITASGGNSGPSIGSFGSTGRMIQRRVSTWLLGTSLTKSAT